MGKEALFYKKTRDKTVRCFLCAHLCTIANGAFGICGVRQNKEGKLFALNYGKLIALHRDPIEKKPLYHFLPASQSYSLASVGCNFRCGFCQNWQISQAHEAKQFSLQTLTLSAKHIVDEAEASGCKSIAYTYTEPTVSFEFAFDCAVYAKEKGLYNIFVTNGYIGKEALRYLRPYLDAANVDLKSFSDGFYRRQCQGRLAPVLETIQLMKRLGIWVEVTTLLIPGENDSEEELEALAQFLAACGKEIPWHISRFFPTYQFSDYKETSPDTLKKAYEIGIRNGLRFVYVGNFNSTYGLNTHCPECGKVLIERRGFSVAADHIKDGCCRYCFAKIDGVF